MRILVVTHYFPPEIGAPQARLSEMARYWASGGDEVTVLTGMPNHPTGIVPKEYQGKLRLVEHVDGYRVVRVWTYATPNQGFIKKTLGHLSFMVSGPLLGLGRLGSCDVVVVSSPTFFSIFSALFVAALKRVPVVIDVRDLWPAIFVELGVLKNRLLIGLLEKLEMWSYHRAAAVVTVSSGFTDNLISRGVPTEKVKTVRNGVDPELFGMDVSSEKTRELLAPPQRVVVLYVGAHGISHGLDYVLDAAASLREAAIHFAFVGEGSERAALLRKKSALGLTNVTMLGGVPRTEVPSLLAAADICLVPLRDVPLFTTFIPSKIFEFLAAGKAVVGAVSGEAAEILSDAGALVVPPADVKALASAISALAADPERRARMGLQGRRYVERSFDRRALAAAFRSVLEDVSGTG